jgi:hypothetical protein
MILSSLARACAFTHVKQAKGSERREERGGKREEGGGRREEGADMRVVL